MSQIIKGECLIVANNQGFIENRSLNLGVEPYFNKDKSACECSFIGNVTRTPFRKALGNNMILSMHGCYIIHLSMLRIQDVIELFYIFVSPLRSFCHLFSKICSLDKTND